MVIQPAQRRPNIRDVARVAGVSYQTVSRALNDHPAIKASTRERVLAAIAELGYRPNAAARALVRQQSLTIGVLNVPSHDYGPVTQTLAIEDAAREAGYRVAITNAASYEVDDIAAGLEFLRGHQVDGFIVLAAVTQMFTALGQLRVGVPYVTMEPTGLALGHSVAVDQLAGGELAVDHLLSLGHERIAHIRGPAHWIDATARHRAYESRMRAAGLEPMPALVGDWTADSGYRLGLELLPRRDCTAVFVANDQMSLGVMHAARELGIDVPGDVSLVGFDDVPEAKHYPSPLTTVHQDFAETGRRAVRMILDDISGREGLVHSLVVPSLVERDSTRSIR